jgi:hypothetical protein
MSFSSPIVRIASGLAIAGVAFIAGFSVSSGYASAKPVDPIVNVNAWSETAPAQPYVRLTSAPADRCNPWDVSDVAMEEVLREMTRRGWRPPRQGNAVEAMEQHGIYGISVDDPDAPMPRRGGGGSGSAYISVLSDAEAARATEDGVAWPESAPQTPVEEGVTVVAPPLTRVTSADR